MHDTYYVTRSDLYRPFRHPLEHLRMVGEQDVAGRDILAGQPGDAEFVEQRRVRGSKGLTSSSLLPMNGSSAQLSPNRWAAFSSALKAEDVPPRYLGLAA